MDLEKLRKPEGRNYLKCILALHYVKVAIFPFVEKVMKEFHEELTHECTHLKLCVTADQNDLVFDKTDGARFKHKCSTSSYFGGGCRQILLNIAGGVSDKRRQKIFEMVKGTNPKEWLQSTFNTASIFLKPWMRSYISSMEDCDISALLRLIITCKPFEIKLSKDTFERLEKVKSTRKIVMMHSSSMEINQTEFLGHIDTITNFLKARELRVRTEVKLAIKEVEQLKKGDFNVETKDRFALIRDTNDAMWKETKYRQENSKTLAAVYAKCDKFMQETPDMKLKNEIAELQKEREVKKKALELYETTLYEINKRIKKLDEGSVMKFMNTVGAVLCGILAIVAAKVTLGASLAVYAGIVYSARDRILTYELKTIPGCVTARTDAEGHIRELSDSIRRIDTSILELRKKLTRK